MDAPHTGVGRVGLLPEQHTMMANVGHLGPFREATKDLPFNTPVFIRDESGGLHRIGEIVIIGKVGEMDERTLVLQAEEL